MIRALASSFGAGNSIFLSRRPDRSRAGSRISTLFVAAITCKKTISEIYMHASDYMPCVFKNDEGNTQQCNKAIILYSSILRKQLCIYSSAVQPAGCMRLVG